LLNYYYLKFKKKREGRGRRGEGKGPADQIIPQDILP
jgi:hypothetical protein